LFVELNKNDDNIAYYNNNENDNNNNSNNDNNSNNNSNNFGYDNNNENDNNNNNYNAYDDNYNNDNDNDETSFHCRQRAASLSAVEGSCESFVTLENTSMPLFDLPTLVSRADLGLKYGVDPILG
jgi:hypothetical protein